MFNVIIEYLSHYRRRGRKVRYRRNNNIICFVLVLSLDGKSSQVATHQCDTNSNQVRSQTFLTDFVDHQNGGTPLVIAQDFQLPASTIIL